MRIIHTIADLRARLGGGADCALVPTMGNLHEGHLSLVRHARTRADLVAASIFVNPLQFAPHEDFARYPRTLARDVELLEGAGCDLLFAPGSEEMYPRPQEFTVHPPAELADVLEGAARPGFFIGVSTVVLKLFNIVRPRVAVFGKKDYQQWRVIEDMVRQLDIAVEIAAGETIRDRDGLALSSRNAYLSAPQRTEAARLHAALTNAARSLRSGRVDWPEIEREAAKSLSERGWEPDYVAIRRRSDLAAAAAGDALVILAAARLGATRLIDNVEV